MKHANQTRENNQNILLQSWFYSGISTLGQVKDGGVKGLVVHSWTGTMGDSESASLCLQGRFKEAPHYTLKGNDVTVNR